MWLIGKYKGVWNRWSALYRRLIDHRLSFLLPRRGASCRTDGKHNHLAKETDQNTGSVADCKPPCDRISNLSLEPEHRSLSTGVLVHPCDVSLYKRGVEAKRVRGKVTYVVARARSTHQPLLEMSSHCGFERENLSSVWYITSS